MAVRTLNSILYYPSHLQIDAHAAQLTYFRFLRLRQNQRQKHDQRQLMPARMLLKVSHKPPRIPIHLGIDANTAKMPRDAQLTAPPNAPLTSPPTAPLTVPLTTP